MSSSLRRFCGDGTVLLRIVPLSDGEAWVVEAADLRRSLERAGELLGSL